MVENSENAESVDNDKEDESPVGDPVAVSISKATKTQLEKSQTDGTIRNRVVNHFAIIEENKRVDLLVAALQKRDEKWREIQKIKPDQVLFDENGKESAAHWTKEQVKKKNEATKALNKMDKAINRAVSEADYEGLKKFTN